MQPKKTSPEALARALTSIAGAWPLEAQEIATHIAAVEAERDEADRQRIAANTTMQSVDNELRALRERVQALEKEVQQRKDWGCLIASAMRYAGPVKDLPAAVQRLVDDLAAIRQWSSADPTTPDTEWWEGYGDAQTEVRGLLGVDATGATATPLDGGTCTNCGVAISEHPETDDCAIASEQPGWVPLAQRTTANPDPSTVERHAGCPDNPCPGYFPYCEKPDAAPAPTSREPSTVAAFTTVREALESEGYGDGGQVMNRLSLLERRMGAMGLAAQRAVDAWEDIDDEAPHALANLADPMVCLRAALTDALPVFTLEDVRREAENAAIEPSRIERMMQRLAALRVK